MTKYLMILAALMVMIACGDENTGDQNDDAMTDDDAVATDDDAVVTGWRTVSAGRNHTCAIWSDGALYCWGDNSYGTLGDGTTGYESMKLSPAKIGTELWVAVSGGGYHTCGIATNGGKLYCWGSNDQGQLGIGDAEIGLQKNVPTKISDDAWLAVAAGFEHTCGIKDDGSLFCWGGNDHGELGDGTLERRAVPTPIDSETWKMVAAGEKHTCALTVDDTLYCWGYNSYGQLGDGNSCPSEDNDDCADKHVPTKIGGAEWSTIAAEGYHTCGTAKEDLSLYCWGNNGSGQIGDGGSGYDAWRSSPVKIGNDAWKAVAPGERHTCGIMTQGAIYCWGNNVFGALGIGTDACPGDGDECEEPSPVKVGEELWRAISAGGDHTCGIRVDGKLYCWGFNESGKLGDGTTDEHPTPVLVADPQ